MKKIGIVAGLAIGVVGAIVLVQARAAAKADDLKQRHAKERADKIVELYDDLVAPTPTLILTGQRSVANIFDVTAMGRVAPVGEFHDHAAVNEYFFALATTPNTTVVSTTMQSLTVSGDKVAVEVDIKFVRSDASTFTLRQTGFFTFNDNDLVTSFDLSILNRRQPAQRCRAGAEHPGHMRGPHRADPGAGRHLRGNLSGPDASGAVRRVRDVHALDSLRHLGSGEQQHGGLPSAAHVADAIPSRRSVSARGADRRQCVHRFHLR